MKEEVKQEEARTCEYSECNKSLAGKRKGARFCSPAHRLKAHRRKSGTKRQFRMHNNVRTDTLELLIALNRHIPLSAEEALRNLAKRIGAPIREDAIDEEFKKIVADFKKGAARREEIMKAKGE